MVKTFGGFKSRKEIMAACRAKGWYINQSAFDRGSDYVSFHFHSGRKRFKVLFNTVNGRFIINDKGKVVTEESAEMDNVKWYAALLDFIYLPNEKNTAGECHVAS